ncbi:MAG: cytochrome c oxidase subunit 3 [Candidatus Brocadiae bacterium]|nr:cytochrome c oxidase subunit 3 [Candidatus Brocadiia bacterium]
MSGEAAAGHGHAAHGEWECEPTPFKASWPKVMMWWFLIGDAVLFGSLLVAYGFNRVAAPAWLPQDKVFSMNFITVMTFTLITSSATMATAVAASRAGDRKNACLFTMLTAVGGIAFLGMQVYEWWHMIGHHGARLTVGPKLEGFPDVPAFSAYFFMITGFHGSHVLSGVFILLYTGFNALRGRNGPEGVELAGLYWHFVDLVWVFVFGTYYLI